MAGGTAAVLIAARAREGDDEGALPESFASRHRLKAEGGDGRG